MQGSLNSGLRERGPVLLALVSLLAVGIAACSSNGGNIDIDGSSTVFPITVAMAEEFGLVSDVRVQVGLSGTGGGFDKFCRGETQVSNASRPIKASEVEACAGTNDEIIEFQVAIDALTIVTNPGNDWATCMTVEQVAMIFKAGGAERWSDVDPSWPDEKIIKYYPGADSGTFDYFTEVVNGESGNCRSDVTFSEDDNVLVRGVAGDADGIGFFGLAYFEENADQLNAVAIDPGDGHPVSPSPTTVENGTYTPLSRPLFVYVSTEAAGRPEVEDFVRFYIEHAPTLAGEVGYVPLPARVYTALRTRFANRVTGTEREGKGSVEELYAGR